MIAEQEKVARANADLHAEDAVRQTKLANRHLYFAHMNLAQASWEDSRVGQTLRLLEQHLPAADTEGGPDDVRDFEWFY